MPSITRLTNNSDETDIASLISKDNIFSIPFFQRPYKWKSDRIKRFQDDLIHLVDEETDFHFLGAVIVHGRRTNPSDPDIFEVIDGQQRLTTVFLFLCATIKILCELKEYDDALGIFQRYIAINRPLKMLSNCKLHSCKEDRAQMNEVIRDLLKDKDFISRLPGFKFAPLPTAAGTQNTGILRTNYSAFCRFLRQESEDGGQQRILDIYSCLLNKVTVVQIDVKDPASGPTIFDSLNSRQEPMTIGDLVRNGIFARVADQSPDEIEIVDAGYWQPFYKGFENGGKNHFDSFFFPYGLTQNSNLKKTEVYNYLSGKWQVHSDPTNIISELVRFQPAFMDFLCGTNTSGLSEAVATSIRRLHRLGAPTSMLPFFMLLLVEGKADGVEDESFQEVLTAAENFLVRRAVCGIEPTGLHSVFKRLWADLKGDLTARNFKSIVLSHKTVSWPDDAEFTNSIKSRPLYGAKITPFLLWNYDISLGGDAPADIPWIEHVLPQTLSTDWTTIFTKSDHDRLVGVLGNLIPLSERMNREVSNRGYSEKRKSFAAGSMYTSARRLAEGFETWDPGSIEKRASDLSEWAIKRWPAI